MKNNPPKILGKTYDYGYYGRTHEDTIDVCLEKDGNGYSIELWVFGSGSTCEEADEDAKKSEENLIRELENIIKSIRQE